MPEGWSETTLGDVANWFSGGTATAGTPLYYENGSIPWAVIADMTQTDIYKTATTITQEGLNAIGGRLAPVGSVLISMYATVGRAAITHVPLATNQAIAWGIPDESQIIQRFLLFVAQYLEAEISSQARGATQRNINREMLRNFAFDLPPLVEQKRIVGLITSVDTYIELLHQHANKSRTARNALLHELLTAGGDGWTETALGDHITLSTGKLDVNAAVDGGVYPFFTCAQEVYQIDVAAFTGKAVLVAGNGDLNVKYFDGEFNAYQRTYVLQAVDEGSLSPEFLYIFMGEYIATLRGDTRGTVIQYLKKAQFTDAPIALPPLMEQKRIVDLIASMDDVIQRIEAIVVDAKKLRSGLLSELLSGAHEIPASYDRFVGAA